MKVQYSKQQKDSWYRWISKLQKNGGKLRKRKKKKEFERTTLSMETAAKTSSKEKIHEVFQGCGMDGYRRGFKNEEKKL